ncbi:hypothetical protein [Flagellimonas sp. C4]
MNLWEYSEVELMDTSFGLTSARNQLTDDLKGMRKKYKKGW